MRRLKKRYTMKKSLLILAACCGAQTVVARELVNKIVARVNGENILHTTMQQPQITKNGGQFSLEEYITQELWVQRAKDRNILPMDEDIARNIAAFKEDNGLGNLSESEANSRLKEMTGLTFEQYRNQLWRHFAAEQLKGMEMRNRSSVSEVEVRTHYESHPEWVQAEYQIEVVYLTQEQRDNWDHTKKNEGTLSWKKMGWLKHNDIAQYLRVIYTLAEGALSEPITIGEKTLVIKLTEKKERHRKTLAERYHEIEMKLQRNKIDHYAGQMERTLRKDAVIVRL